MYKFVYTLYIQKWNFVAESSAVGWYGFLTGIFKVIFEKNLRQGDIMNINFATSKCQVNYKPFKYLSKISFKVDINNIIKDIQKNS